MSLLRHRFSHALLAAALLSAMVAGLLRCGFPSAGADLRPAATPRCLLFPAPGHRGSIRRSPHAPRDCLLRFARPATTSTAVLGGPPNAAPARWAPACSAPSGCSALVDHANSQVPSALASLTKGGLNAVTKALAIEYAGRGIRANAVALGVIRTPMHDPASYDALAKLHPVGRLGEIDDVVDAVLYLENAGFVTGEILHVDGGQSAGH